MQPKTASFDFLDLKACKLCASRFAATATSHSPRPVFQGQAPARILIASQAPGVRVHESGQPFTDPSGDRLRAWMGIGDDIFYDAKRIAILPMSFCFPGYDAKSADLPPPPLCARKWRPAMLSQFPNVLWTILIGGYAQKWHLQTRSSVHSVVADWQVYLPHFLPLPHPSWRNNAWLKKNEWFEAKVVPVLRQKVQEALL